MKDTVRGHTVLSFYGHDPVLRRGFVNNAGSGTLVFEVVPIPISYEGALVVIENTPPAALVLFLIYTFT